MGRRPVLEDDGAIVACICWEPRGVAGISANVVGLDLLSNTPSPIWMFCGYSALAGFAYIAQGWMHLIVSKLDCLSGVFQQFDFGLFVQELVGPKASVER